MLIDPASRFAGGLAYSTYPTFERPATDRFERALLADSVIHSGQLAMRTAVWPHLYADVHGVPLLVGLWDRGRRLPAASSAPLSAASIDAPHAGRPASASPRCRIATPRSDSAPSTSAVARAVPEAIRNHMLGLLKQTDCWAISLGRYTQHIRRFLRLIGIDLPDPAQAVRGIYMLDGKQHEFTYMKDAAIPRFVARKDGRFGFAGSHQIIGTMAGMGPDAPLEYLGVVQVPRARLALAATQEEKRRSIIERKLARAELLKGCTEYEPAAREVVESEGLNLVLSSSVKGMAETDAAENQCVEATLAIVSSGTTLKNNRLGILDGWDDLMPIWINAVWNLGATPATLQSEAAALWPVDLEDLQEAEHAVRASATRHWVLLSNAIQGRDFVPIAPRGSAFASRGILAIVQKLLEQTPGWALPKGLNESPVLHLLAALGIELPASNLTMVGQYETHRFWYLRDVAIPTFVAAQPGRLGFVASHQVFEANPHGELGLLDVPVLTLPAARFVLATPADKADEVERKLAGGGRLRLYCEHRLSGAAIVSRYGWDAEVLHSHEDTAEIDAAKDEHSDGALTIVSELDRTGPNGLKIIRNSLQQIGIHLVCNPGTSVRWVTL